MNSSRERFEIKKKQKNDRSSRYLFVTISSYNITVIRFVKITKSDLLLRFLLIADFNNKLADGRINSSSVCRVLLRGRIHNEGRSFDRSSPVAEIFVETAQRIQRTFVGHRCVRYAFNMVNVAKALYFERLKKYAEISRVQNDAPWATI